MKAVGVMMKGMKTTLYFEVDEWSAEDGVLRLTRYDLPGVIAAFPFENLLGIVDLTANGRLEAKDVKEKVAAAKGSLSVDILTGQASVRMAQQ